MLASSHFCSRTLDFLLRHAPHAAAVAGRLFLAITSAAEAGGTDGLVERDEILVEDLPCEVDVGRSGRKDLELLRL